MRREITRKYIGKRCVATFIDYTIIMVLSFCYIYLAGDPDGRGTYVVNGWGALVPFVIWFLYFVVTESEMGGTPGHQIMKLKVMSVNNEPVTMWRIVKRRFPDILEITWCFGLIAWLVAKSTPDHQRIGDLLAQACVVGEKEEDLEFRFDFEKTQPAS